MPLLEVLLASTTAPTRQQKRAFAAAIQLIFAEELGTPPATLRLAITHLAVEDTIGVLTLSETVEASPATEVE